MNGSGRMVSGSAYISPNALRQDKRARILEAAFSRFASNQGLVRIPILEQNELPTVIFKELKSRCYSKILRVQRAVSRVIQEGIEQDEFRRLNPDCTAIAFMALIRSSLIYWRLWGRKAPDQTQLFRSIFFRGIEKKGEV